jgi:hypothetical protein
LVVFFFAVGDMVMLVTGVIGGVMVVLTFMVGKMVRPAVPLWCLPS